MTDNLKITRYHILMGILTYAQDINEDIADMLDVGVMSIEEFIDEVIMELIRYAYDKNMPRKSMRSHLIDSGIKDDDSIRMAYSRVMEYVQKYRDREADFYNDFIGLHPEALDALPMDAVEERLAGYQITRMNFFELTKLQDIRVLKSMVEHRIDNTKRVDNTRFQELFEEYESFVDSLVLTKEMSDEDVVFNSVAYWVLEWKYPFELFYRIALHMDENDYKEIERHQIGRLAGYCAVHRPHGNVSSPSRFIKRRNEMVPRVIYAESKETDDNEYDVFTLEEYLFLKRTIY